MTGMASKRARTKMMILPTNLFNTVVVLLCLLLSACAGKISDHHCEIAAEYEAQTSPF